VCQPRALNSRPEGWDPSRDPVAQMQILKVLYRSPEAPLSSKSTAEFKVNLSHPLSPLPNGNCGMKVGTVSAVVC